MFQQLLKNQDTENTEKGVLFQHRKAPSGMSAIKAASPLKGSGEHGRSTGGAQEEHGGRWGGRGGRDRMDLNLKLAPILRTYAHDGRLQSPGLQEAPPKHAFLPQPQKNPKRRVQHLAP